MLPTSDNAWEEIGMNTTFDSLTHKMQRAALGKTADIVLSHVNKDREKAVT